MRTMEHRFDRRVQGRPQPRPALGIELAAQLVHPIPIHPPTHPRPLALPRQPIARVELGEPFGLTAHRPLQFLR
jgi:hypothetical protein